jgi:hypothetical protein
MEEDTGMELETRVALLVDRVGTLLTSVDRMTEELRHTNESVTGLHFAVRAQDESLARMRRELYTADDASRIRGLELRVKGLFTVCGFIAMWMLGQFLAGLLHWPASVPGK